MSELPAGHQRTRQVKMRFTPQEDELIRSLVGDQRTQPWAEIAALIPNRTAKQIRERFENYLKPTVNMSPWTAEEEQMIQTLVGEMGQQWGKMTGRFNNRTDIQIKHRYLKMQRRSAKIWNQMAGRQTTPKPVQADAIVSNPPEWTDEELNASDPPDADRGLGWDLYDTWADRDDGFPGDFFFFEST
jgi:hypothetical protein